MVKRKNYYERLGLSKSASLPEIKQAYRELAKRFHPDVSEEVDAEQQFVFIAEAYEILSDPQKRNRYDWTLRYRSRSRQPSAPSKTKPREDRNSVWFERQQRRARQRARSYANMSYERYSQDVLTRTTWSFYATRILVLVGIGAVVFVPVTLVLILTQSSTLFFFLSFAAMGLIAYFSTRFDMWYDSYIRQKRLKRLRKERKEGVG